MARIEHLPQEIIDIIIGCFYNRRTSPPSWGPIIDANYSHDEQPAKKPRELSEAKLLNLDGYAGVRALGQTNKFFHALTRPYVYRAIRVDKRVKIDCLVRTLLENPALACHLRMLEIAKPRLGGPVTAELAEKCNQMFRWFNITDKLSEPTSLCINEIDSDSHILNETPSLKLVPLLLILACHVEDLTLHLGDIGEEAFFVKKPPKFPKLKRLRMGGYSSPFRIRLFRYHQWILYSAKNLHTLHIEDVDELYQISHPTLSMLDYTGYGFTPDEAYNLFTSFPKLSGLRYISSAGGTETGYGDRLVHPKGLISMMNHFKIRLDYVYIQADIDEEELEPDEAMPFFSLKGLRAKTLHLDLNDYKRLEGETIKRFYRRIIPTAIERLVLTETAEEHDLKALVETLKSHAPRLKQIAFPYDKYEDKANLRYPKFDSNPPPIECRFYSAGSWESSPALWLEGVPILPF